MGLHKRVDFATRRRQTALKQCEQRRAWLTRIISHEQAAALAPKSSKADPNPVSLNAYQKQLSIVNYEIDTLKERITNPGWKRDRKRAHAQSKQSKHTSKDTDITDAA